ncbi:MAG: hypothetical protein DCC44_00225 [Acidobacteria bacterium]|nr:hypothetical protein [Pyrinomonadaceae bacterium]RIJ96788.1 MAG: hypothetical protein DCC44_00225 [Acidobacteriota bacterium]
MKPIITACLSVLFLVFCGCTVAKSTNTNVSAAESTNAEPAATPMSGAGKVNLPAPETVVQALYKAHDAKKSPFFQSKDRALVDKYFSKPLADLIWKDATTHTSDVGVIDGDPLYNAQDVEIKDLKIGTGQIDAKNEKKATVNVTFTNFGKPNTIKFEMSAGAESWKIDDIVYSPSDSMLKWFKEADKPADTPAVAGEFEGKYRVGETTCTVKPVKMAYEVRWEKGKGVEMFFSKNSTTFESSPPKGDPNQFVFDDESYNTGTFYRADGKTFPVSRAN